MPNAHKTTLSPKAHVFPFSYHLLPLVGASNRETNFCQSEHLILALCPLVAFRLIFEILDVSMQEVDRRVIHCHDSVNMFEGKARLT